MREEIVTTYQATIFIAGDRDRAERICREYCDEVGLCVTIEPLVYVYTGGNEAGVRVGLINYPRFPSEPEAIFDHARTLANKLMLFLHQQSVSIVASDRTLWLSRRPVDVD